jgi:hypothetical protein
MKCCPPRVLQVRQEQSRPCPISNFGEVPRQIEGWRCQEELHPKTPEPLLVLPTKATTGVLWASLGGSIAPTATREWRAWSPNSLAPRCSCVSQSLNVCSFCICASVWMAVVCTPRPNLPLSFLTGLCSMAHGSPLISQSDTRGLAAALAPSTFSSVRKLRLWYPYA